MHDCFSMGRDAVFWRQKTVFCTMEKLLCGGHPHIKLSHGLGAVFGVKNRAKHMRLIYIGGRESSLQREKKTKQPE